MPTYKKLEQSFTGYIAMYHGADTVSFGRFSRLPHKLRERVRNDAVIANVKRVREIAREIHNADIKTETELRKQRQKNVNKRTSKEKQRVKI